MKLAQNDGKVEFIMRCEKDLVKNTMPVKAAEKIISKAKSKKTSPIADGFTLCIDDKFYFKVENGETEHLGTATPKKRKKSTERE